LELKSILQYQILQLISVGAHGKLYRAFDSYTGQVVALKVLYTNLTSNVEYVEQLKSESKVISSFDHENIVKVFEIGNTEDNYFISLEYLPENLDRILEKNLETPIKRVIDIGSQIASGLSKAHSMNVIHKDIKPQNILVGSDGKLKIVDFGIAYFNEKLSLSNSTSTVISTPYYISPEHITGETITPASDIYSLGCILYQIISGHLPHFGDSPFIVFRKHIEEMPEKLNKFRKDIPKDLMILIESCIEKKITNRIQTADEFLNNLNSIKIPANNSNKTYKENPQAILDEPNSGVKNVIKSVNPQAILDESKAGVKNVIKSVNPQAILDESKAGVKDVIHAVNPQAILDESKAGVKDVIHAVNPQAILDESKAGVKSAIKAVPTTWMDDVTRTWERTHRNRWAKIGTIASLALAITGLIIRFGFWDEIQSFAEQELNVELPALVVNTEIDSNNLNAIQNIDSTLNPRFEISEKYSSSVYIYDGIELHFPIGAIEKTSVFEFYKSNTEEYKNHIKQFSLKKTPMLPDNYQNYKDEMIFSIFEYDETLKTFNYSYPVNIVIRFLPESTQGIPTVFMWNSILKQWELLENKLLSDQILIAKMNNTGLIGIFMKK
tara:strand:- start:5200 stop:7032 length:1833 start_codon:yes stop_codon:yes gene_type:complete